LDPVAIFLTVFLLALVLLFVIQPFFGRQRAHSVESGHEISYLLAERERLLVAIQELDSDQSLGKIPPEDYPVQRAELIQRGVEVLRKIDALSPDTARATVEKEAKQGPESPARALLSDEALEDLLESRRNVRKDKTDGFCPNCGKPVLISDTFCPACGHALKQL
jgi:hypothetical protein